MSRQTDVLVGGEKRTVRTPIPGMVTHSKGSSTIQVSLEPVSRCSGIFCLPSSTSMM